MISSVLWIALITVLHGSLNLRWFKPAQAGQGAGTKFGVGFIPVTCHLTCPVTDYINKNGGIDGQNLEFTFLDDQTSPQVAVQLTNTAMASQPAVIMGSSLVGMCLAMAPLMKNGPVQYCLSPAIHPKPGGYTFSASSSSIDQIAAVMRYYRLKGWTKLAVLDTTDASGQDGDRAINDSRDDHGGTGRHGYGA